MMGVRTPHDRMVVGLPLGFVLASSLALLLFLCFLGRDEILGSLGSIIEPSMAAAAGEPVAARTSMRSQLMTAVAGWIVTLLAMVALTVGLMREWRRRGAVERELSLSRDRLVTLLSHTVDGLISIDEKGTILSFNRPAGQIFGYAPADVLGRNVSLLMPEPYRSAHDGYIAEYLTTGRAKVIGSGREVQGRRQDGSVFPMDLAVVEIPGRADGRQFVGTVRDITRQKALESQLRQAQKVQAVGQLTGGIAHDFNNLLAVMMGNIDMARDAMPDAAGRALLDRAMAAAGRGAELTRRLLAFSRRQTLLPARIDINRAVLDVVALLGRTLGETIRVETKLGAGPLYALVDASELESALLNLAVNARDAMPGGGVLSIATGSIELDDWYAGGNADVVPGTYCLISVSDNGMGMTADVKDRVFDPFFTTKEVGKGSGLGLSMVYGFVKQSGGHVSIYSEPERGTTIRLYLPSCDQEQPAAEVQQPLPRGAFGDGRRLLVVEDDIDVRNLVASMAERLGFRPLVATDGPQALEVLNGTDPIDLMITDIIMPKGVSGVDLARQARQKRPGLPVLFISGYSDDTEALAEVIRSGAAFLSKPFSRAQLAGAIEAALRGQGT